MAIKLIKDSIDIGIITKDVEPMLNFYRDTLGLTLGGEMDLGDGGRITRLTCGSTVVKLVVHGKAPPAEAPPGGIRGATGYRYWTITISNLEEVTNECAEAGFSIPVPVTEFLPGVRMSIIEDPDGNWVELVQLDG
jgi:glyoxylase I family protein